MTEQDEANHNYEIELPPYVEGEDPEFDAMVELGAQTFEQLVGGEATDFDRVMAGLAAENRRLAARSRFSKQERSPKEQKRHEKAVAKRRKAKRGGPR